MRAFHKIAVLVMAILSAACSGHREPEEAPSSPSAVLQDGQALVAIGDDGSLQSLKSLVTGIDYAGGAGL